MLMHLLLVRSLSKVAPIHVYPYPYLQTNSASVCDLVGLFFFKKIKINYICFEFFVPFPTITVMKLRTVQQGAGF